jgi:hypothetical protein
MRTTRSDELAEILADGPIRQMKQSRVTERAAVAKDEVDGEDTVICILFCTTKILKYLFVRVSAGSESGPSDVHLQTYQ